MLVKNTHSTPLALPGQQVIPALGELAVRDWDKIKKLPVIAAWLKAGVLVEGDSLPPSPLLAPDREAIVARLRELGVTFHPNTGTEKLQAKLAEAEAAAALADAQAPSAGAPDGDAGDKSEG